MFEIFMTLNDFIFLNKIHTNYKIDIEFTKNNTCIFERGQFYEVFVDIFEFLSHYLINIYYY